MFNRPLILGISFPTNKKGSPMKQLVVAACADPQIAAKIDHALAGEYTVRPCRSIAELNMLGSAFPPFFR